MIKIETEKYKVKIIRERKPGEGHFELVASIDHSYPSPL